MVRPLVAPDFQACSPGDGAWYVLGLAVANSGNQEQGLLFLRAAEELGFEVNWSDLAENRDPTQVTEADPARVSDGTDAPYVNDCFGEMAIDTQYA